MRVSENLLAAARSRSENQKDTAAQCSPSPASISPFAFVETASHETRTHKSPSPTDPDAARFVEVETLLHVVGEIKELKATVHKLQLQNKLQHVSSWNELQQQLEQRRPAAGVNVLQYQMGRKRPPRAIAALWAHGLDIMDEGGSGPTVLGLALMMRLQRRSKE